MIARQRRRLLPLSGASLVPMIDVVFQLVIFFMVSTTFRIAPAIILALPQSATAEPVTLTELVVTIADRDEIYLNGQLLSLDQLAGALSSPLGDQAAALNGAPGATSAVVVEGDRSVPYDLMIAVLDILRQQGVVTARLRTSSPSAAGTAPQ